ncbi:coagulation factor XIII A chain-like isoform X2 [Sander lucioperca]|uniref:coagulation factor XIII A chain-like isoform X2 n=1 Tax=Sander lucioperca TaxID=283035 RepID=UPI0016539EFC|nr:coagulation factor XIII A chain-like isoform X2 [Sander lucioperca]
MSLSKGKSHNHKGRYTEPVSTSNLGHSGEDFPLFEPFPDAPTARAPADAGAYLSVQKVDMCQQTNELQHQTASYNTPNLVVRRGQEFLVRVTFNRPLEQSDDFQLEFLIGEDPSASRGSLVVVTFNSRPGGPWSGQIVESQGATVTLGITPTPDAIVGRFRTNVAIVMATGMQRTNRDAATDVYVLFNAWCKDDAVFLPNEAERNEYVLNDHGVMYQGSFDAVTTCDWVYGQFERGVLDACIYILDASKMPINDRGNIIKVIRMGSAMINAQDDNGVCVGNWSDDYSMGRSPTSWTGSVQILLQYAKTGIPVGYAQCWVFAGVFNTFLRTLGIPARTVTNFVSAHDSNGNLKIDLICLPDGLPDDQNTRDSIWNYHCWNEVFIRRDDLPPGLEGWQVVDATPQETSDGYFRCGPVSMIAVKEGLLCHPFDAGFVFSEVNSDVVFYQRSRYGTLTPYWVETDYIGKAVYTKSLGSNSPNNITQNYKYLQGSAEDKRTKDRANEYGMESDQSELPEITLSIIINARQVNLGQDVNLQVDFHNHSDVPKTVQANLACSVIFYTGVRASHLKNHNFTITVPANQMKSELVKLTANEYMPYLGTQICLHFIVTGQIEDESVTAIKVLELKIPTLTVTLSGLPQVRQQMFANVTFTNPFNFALKDCRLAMEGAGVMSEKTLLYEVIEPHASISWKESFIPRLAGKRCIVAVMDCSNLCHLRGVACVNITP